jgi:hypothetical protein
MMQSKVSFMHPKGFAVVSCPSLIYRFSPQSQSVFKVSINTVINPITRTALAALPMNSLATADSFRATNSHISREGNQAEMVHFSVDYQGMQTY